MKELRSLQKNLESNFTRDIKPREQVTREREKNNVLLLICTVKN